MRLDHLTINVVNMEDSVAFYGSLLGMTKLEAVDMGDHEIQYMQIDERNRLELIRYKYDTPERGCRADERGIYRHMALEVADLEELYDRLKRAGAEITMEPGFCDKLNFENMLVKDPNGVEIELVRRQQNGKIHIGT